MGNNVLVDTVNNPRWFLLTGVSSWAAFYMSKAGKHRMCPAVGHEISPAECGEGRGSKYACPAECGFNPFAPANYGQLLELEAELDQRSLARLDEDATDRAALARDIQRAMGAKMPHQLHALIVWRFLFQTDTGGRTCAQRWEQAGFPGFRNDLRVLMRAKMNLRIVLLEVHRVLDSEQVEVVDLLEAKPAPFIVRDRGFASSAARFATGLTWAYALPHYQRMFGSAILVPDISCFEPETIVREIVRHLGGPAEEGPLRRWLAEHFVRVDEALTAWNLERRRQMLASIDAKFGKAVYELRAPFATCCETLDQEPDVVPEDLADGERREGFADARVWFSGKADGEMAGAPTPGGQLVLGRVLLGQTHWRLETLGSERMAVLRRLFERCMGAHVRFTGERLDDLSKSLAERDPKPDLTLVPPRLLENPNKILLSTARLPQPISSKSHSEIEREAFGVMEREFLNHGVPALDGRTPREAARDPQLRPKLIRLMKSRIRQCDERNLETGEHRDANWMLRELGLHEILFDPPPAGRRPKAATPGSAAGPFDDDDDSDLDEDFVSEDETAALPMDPALPPAPPLPDRPFTLDEVQQRLAAALERYDLAEEAIEQLEAEGCTLISDVDEVTPDLVEEDSFPLLVPLLVQIWRAFVPDGRRGVNLPRSVLRQAIFGKCNL